LWIPYGDDRNNVGDLNSLVILITEHPGSTGGWAATFVEYDILGRMKRRSVPTETNSGFTPTGDDSAGPLWTYQKYDWKGRVVRKINTDGIDQTALNDSDILISYEGCGCAGGQVTTTKISTHVLNFHSTTRSVSSPR